MDYAFSYALKYFGGDIKRFVLFYDVICQYFKNLKKRLKKGKYTEWPSTIDFRFLCGIGQWHIHGHKKDCFARFAPLFLPGIGWVDGEVVETLWSYLNEASGSLRAMGSAHRQESLDMLMSESNWRKLIGMGVFISFTTAQTIANVL